MKILFDVDGLILKPWEVIFSEKFAKKMGINSEEVTDFFVNEYVNCRLGNADLEEEISKYLKKWKWEGTVKELIEYWFINEPDVNPEALEIVDSLRKKGIECYMVSDQSKHRSLDLRERLGLEKHFDGHFFSCDLHLVKKDPEFYKKIIEELGTSDLIFFDDSQSKVDAAKEAGIEAHLFTSLAELKGVLRSKGISI